MKERRAYLSIVTLSLATMILAIIFLLNLEPSYEVVYEKNISAMLNMASRWASYGAGYDYIDNNGAAYLKVENEDEEGWEAIKEDLAAHSKVNEYDCVAIDHLVDREIVAGSYVERNPSYGDDIAKLEDSLGDLDEVPRLDDLYGGGLVGAKNPEGY